MPILGIVLSVCAMLGVVVGHEVTSSPPMRPVPKTAAVQITPVAVGANRKPAPANATTHLSVLPPTSAQNSNGSAAPESGPAPQPPAPTPSAEHEPAPSESPTAVIPSTPIAAGVAGQPAAAWAEGQPQFDAPAAAPATVGVNYHGMWREYDDPLTRDRVLGAYQAAGVTWVRMDLAWATLQPDPPSSASGGYDFGWGVAMADQRLQEIADHGMKAVVVLFAPPQWSSGTSAKNGQPSNPADYGNVLGWAASRWSHVAPVWEMWNEPDQSTFWHSEDPTQFAQLLKASYPIAKAKAPSVTFIAGAPTYVQPDWYKSLFAAGVRRGAGYDAIGVHPYMGVATLDPAAGDDGSPYRIAHIGALTKLLADQGASGTAIWATEFGWSTHSNTGREANHNVGVSRNDQAVQLLKATAVMGRYPQLVAAFWYTDKDTIQSDVHQASFGLLDRSFEPKAGYFALKCAVSGVCGKDSAPRPEISPGETAERDVVETPAAAVPQSRPEAVPAEPVTRCRIEDPRLPELSGLASSLEHPGIVWTHNDSGDGARVFGVDTTSCQVKAVVNLRGVEAVDFEAIAMSSDSSGAAVIWVGDIGDNAASRRDVRLYRFAEPLQLGDQDVDVQAISITYADGARDAEGLLADQRPGGSVWLVSKEADAGIYALPADFLTAGQVVATRVGGAASYTTDAALSPEGTRMVQRSGDVATFAELVPGSSVKPMRFPSQRQGEAVTFSPDGRSVLIVSEGATDLIEVPVPALA